MFEEQTSSSRGLSTIAQVAILVAIPFFFLGVYYLLAPISELRTQTGGVFGCGSAIGGPENTFKANICGSINTTYLYKGVLSIAAGATIAAAGIFVFGKRNDQSVQASASTPTNHAPSRLAQAANTPSRAEDAPEPEFANASRAQSGSRQRPRTFD